MVKLKKVLNIQKWPFKQRQSPPISHKKTKLLLYPQKKIEQKMASEKAIDSEQIIELEALVNKLEREPAAGCFLEPVDHEGLGLTDYLLVVKKPMDLRTCKTLLRKGKYGSYGELFSDIELIWSNCKAYNTEGSDIYDLACQMEAAAKRAISQFNSKMLLSGN